jgi:Domain of unknown function (DUF4783)
MNKLIFCILVLLPLVTFANTGTPVAVTQQVVSNIDDITRALNSGDADALGRYFADNIEIAINDNEQQYNKAKAVDVVRAFFNSARPQSFSTVHQGNSREASGGQYCIGDLKSGLGKYRVYVYMKSAQIHELRFEKE